MRKCGSFGTREETGSVPGTSGIVGYSKFSAPSAMEINTPSIPTHTNVEAAVFSANMNEMTSLQIARPL